MTSEAKPVDNAGLAARVARLWPHREHESSLLLSQLCRAGWHRWRRLDLREIAPGKDIAHCFWCSKVKMDGVVYEA